MPIKVDRVDAGIYRAIWYDVVTIDEIFLAGKEAVALATEDNLTRYVSLLDGTDIDSIPHDLRDYLKVIQKNVHSILILNPPLAGELIGNMLNKLKPNNFEIFKDRDAWLARGRVIQASLMKEDTRKV